MDVAEYIKIVIKSYSSSLSDALGISEYVNLNHVHDYLYYLTAFDSVAITESITVVMNKRFANIYDFFGLTEWSDVLITVGAITDADRLIIVSAEDRFMNVSAEDRFIHVPFEDRFINPGD